VIRALALALALLASPADFDGLSAVLSGVPYVKLVVQRPATGVPVHFFDAKRYPMHLDFVKELVPGGYPGGWQALNDRCLTAPDRPFLYATLAKYAKDGHPLWALEIFEGDRMGPDLAQELFQAVRSKFFDPAHLFFKPASQAQEAMRSELEKRGIPVVTSAELYEGREYILLNAGKATGRLRLVESIAPGEELLFDRREIVILGELPNDITPVKGILTTRVTTPLSHVNLRATAWGIPSAMWKGALAHARARGLEGKVVVLEARAAMDAPVLRAATPAEIAAWEQAEEERPRVSPPADLTVTDIRALEDLRAVRGYDAQNRPYGDGRIYGAKAANLAEVLSLTREVPLPAARALMVGDMRLLFSQLGADPALPHRLSTVTSRERARVMTRGRLNVPPAFAIPFAAYRAFLDDPANAEIKRRSEALLTDPEFQSSPRYRKAYLAELRALIRAGRFPPAHEAALRARLESPPYARRGVFVRSSTNSEDLPDFNGAGLYDTVPNVLGADRALDAVKAVWASIWNFKAYEEREHYGIRHQHVYPGVLVQVGVDADGAGVLITRNPFESQDRNRIYLNARRGLGIGVVDGQHVPEQLLMDTYSLTISRLSQASGGTIIVFDPDGGVHEVPAPGNGPIVDEKAARQLAYVSRIIEAHFSALYKKDQPQDIEWLVDDGVAQVVQSRPYIGGK
jgi:hypothetical protein